MYSKLNYTKLVNNKKILLINCDSQNKKATEKLFEYHGATIAQDYNPNNDYDADVIIFGMGDLPVDYKTDFIDISNEFSYFYKSASNAVNRCIKHMQDKKEGTIIAILPQYSDFTVSGSCGLSVISGALKSYIKSLSADYCKYNIRANCMEFAYDFKAYLPQTSENILNIQPLNRNITPDDAAMCALFLASDMSAFISGESIPVNGGVFGIGHNEAWRGWLKKI